MIIKAKWFETEFAGEETDGPGEAAHEKRDVQKPGAVADQRRLRYHG